MLLLLLLFSASPYFKFGADWTKARCFRNLVSTIGENHLMSVKTVLFSRISCFYRISPGKRLLLLPLPLLILVGCFWILNFYFSFSGSCRVLLFIHPSKFLLLKFMCLTVPLIMLLKFVMLYSSFFVNMLLLIAKL